LEIIVEAFLFIREDLDEYGTSEGGATIAIDVKREQKLTTFPPPTSEYLVS
jgi:hypothetical protein